MTEHLIELRDITKSFGSIYALGGVSLHVNPGEVVGLLGDNGAGKSTLIKILAGVIKPTSGEIIIQGKHVSNWTPARSRAAGPLPSSSPSSGISSWGGSWRVAWAG
jgi:simple sugar transport system ATP-binding protein